MTGTWKDNVPSGDERGGHWWALSWGELVLSVVDPFAIPPTSYRQAL